MKTLDEVIELSERCTLPYPGDCLNCEYFEDETGYDCRCKIIADALHYLKEYRSKQDTIAEQLAELEQKNDHVREMAITVCKAYERLCKRLAEEYRNDPLSWDELKAMEGKPVWVEIGGYIGQWDIVHMITPHLFSRYYAWPKSPDDPMKAPVAELNEENYGKTWQAYRKERHEG